MCFLQLLLYSAFYIYPIMAIPGRVLQGCVALDHDVYCYGGYIAASGGVFTTPTNGHFTFDIRTVDLTKGQITPRWNALAMRGNSFPVQLRAAAQITALDNNRYMLLGGGHNNPLNTSAAIYDKMANAWAGLDPPPFYMAEGSMVSSDVNTVWAYGGKLNSTPNYTPNNLLKMDMSSGTAQWTMLPMTQGGPAVGRYGHSQTIRGNIIYFFGGFFNLPEENLKPNVIPFDNLTWYNTETNQWSQIQTRGNIPSSRKYLTSTLIPNSTQILIYGGTATANLQALPLEDYCYIFDINKHSYTAINFTRNTGAGPRIGHSAVVYQTNVLILMGYDRSGNLLNDTHVLDVSVPNTPVWVGDDNQAPSDPDGNGNDTGGNSLATGAIVGVAIGCVAFVAIIGGIALVLYRKRRQRKNNNDDYLQPPQNFDVDIPPTMFPENDSQQKNNPINDSDHTGQHNHPHSTNYTNDPVASYPPIKPYQDDPSPEVPINKPAGSD